jgi:hypothetical protein
MLKLLLLFMWLLFVALIMTTLQLYNDTVYYEKRKIHDIFFSFFQNVKPEDVPAFFHPDIFICLFIFAYLTCLPSLKMLKKMFFLLSISYILRTVTMSSTILPPSNETCKIFSLPMDRAFQILPYSFNKIIGMIETCTDKIFSGHASVCTLLTLSWFNDIKKNPFIPLILSLLVIGSSLFRRYHYSVDIILSIIINTMLYELYKTSSHQIKTWIEKDDFLFSM